MANWPVTYSRKVRFSDSDAQGIVFNGNYLTYFDDTITDYLEVIGIPWDDLVAKGFETVLARVEIDYRSPGRLGETLLTGARIDRIGTTSMTFELQTWEEATGRVVVEGRELHVMLDHETFAKTAVPGWFVEAVEAAQGGRVER